MKASITSRTAVLAFCLGLLAGAPFSRADGVSAPGPALEPDEVVRIQLEALRGNDPSDGGIAVAFSFASPGNKRTTGPLPRFAAMIKGGPYRLMLDYVAADYDGIEIAGDRARQRVMLVGRDGSSTFTFYLSRQPAPGCDGRCWMTDAVTAAPFDGHST